MHALKAKLCSAHCNDNSFKGLEVVGEGGEGGAIAWEGVGGGGGKALPLITILFCKS